MRVLEVVHGFPPAAHGGGEIYAQSHAHALRATYDDEVLVLTREQDSRRPEYDVRVEERDGLRIMWINNTFRRTRSFEETYRNEAIGALACRAIDDFKPDVAHIHHLTGLSTTIVHALAERGIPRIVTLHDYWLLCHRGQLLDLNHRVCDGPDPARCHACVGAAGGVGTLGYLGAVAVRAFERSLPGEPARVIRQAATRIATLAPHAREADRQASRRLDHMRDVCRDVTHFLAPSRFMRDRFVQFGVAAERITIAPYGISADRLREVRRISSKRLRLGFLGTLMVSKAPHLLIEAADRLRSASVSVDLFGAYSPYHGDDSYRQQLEPLLRQNGVHVRGNMPHDRLAEVFASIDALVVPSIWPENSPLVIQEAFLAGVPVVAARIGGIPEALIDGRGGLLFRAGDVEDLARVLARLIEEPDLLATLRASIPPVRTIQDDVKHARTLYLAGTTARRKRLAAVVLSYRTPDDTLLAVRSLLASRRPIDEVIVVNNDAPDESASTLDVMGLPIRYVSTGANLGFSGGINVGIREALARGADRVLLVNSDVIAPPDCVQRLETCLDASPGCGIVGPVVLARSDPRLITSLGMSYADFSGRMRHHGVGVRISSLERANARTVDAVSGCLMLVDRAVFDAVGLFDDDYFFSFEDLDFCLKARRAGFVVMLASFATAYHEGGRSIGPASPRRLYFATRGHLLLAQRAGSGGGRTAALLRTASILMLNVAHALRARGGSLPARLGAVTRGARDYFLGRFGADA